MTTDKRVLLTGGTGFIGRHAIPLLQSLGYDVHTISRQSDAGAILHVGDLSDDARIGEILKTVRPSHLLHLAWDVTPGEFWSARTNLDWVAASLRLYRGFVACGGSRAVFAGTFAEYDWDFEILEEYKTPLRPRTMYGAAKCALHDLVRRASDSDGVNVAWARLFMLYGPHERPERLVPYITTALLDGQPALCGDGAVVRDFMHVADAARAMVRVMDSDYRGAINIASGSAAPTGDVMTEIARLTGRPDLLAQGARPSAPGEERVLAASVTALKDGLGFKPAFSLAEGLADTVSWWRAQLGR